MTVVHKFTDGAQVAVDETGAVSFLTPCCHASGKGWDVGTGVVCRKCFAEVSEAFGDVGVPAGQERPEYGITHYDRMLRRWLESYTAAHVSAQVERLARDGKVVPSSGGRIQYW